MDGYAYWPCICFAYQPGLDLHCVGPLALGEFRNIFLASTDEDQKKVLPSERGAPHVVPYGKSAPGYYITFITKLHEGLR